jgi:hypothetical protein
MRDAIDLQIRLALAMAGRFARDSPKIRDTIDRFIVTLDTIAHAGLVITPD